MRPGAVPQEKPFMSSNKKTSAKAAKPASAPVKKSAKPAPEKKSVASAKKAGPAKKSAAPAKKSAAPAKKSASPEVYPGETAAERIIEADFKVVKGQRSDVWRDCVGAGRIGEGLRDTWRKQLA